MDDEAVEATLARIYSRDDRKDDYAALEIDAVLQSRYQSKQLPLIRPLAEAKFLTRRAMEVGYYAVLHIRQNSRPESAAGFESLEDNAKTASNAIGKVLRSLDPSAKAGAEFELAIVTTLEGFPASPTLVRFTFWPDKTGNTFAGRGKSWTAFRVVRRQRELSYEKRAQRRRNPRTWRSVRFLPNVGSP